MVKFGQQAEKIVPSCCTVKKSPKKACKIEKVKNKKAGEEVGIRNMISLSCW